MKLFPPPGGISVAAFRTLRKYFENGQMIVEDVLGKLLGFRGLNALCKCSHRSVALVYRSA
jgi:hypothetical protein